MTHRRIRKFNTRDTYPEQKLDNGGIAKPPKCENACPTDIRVVAFRRGERDRQLGAVSAGGIPSASLRFASMTRI